MQSLETGPDIWRRASPSPAPRPVLANAEDAPPSAAIIRRRRARPHRLPRCFLAVLLGLAVLGGTASNRTGVADAIERLCELAGLGLVQVSATGYRFTAASDIFAALDVAHTRTLIFFDSRAARARIEALPWVDKASIERILPDRIEVRISERTPVAVWQRAERSFLVDKTGRVLAAVAGSALPLPHMSGQGAPAAVAELIDLSASYPALFGELRLAERVGERRWTLWLADGGSILLPAQGAAAALARAIGLRGLLAGRATAIDLRVASRALLSDAAPERAAASGI